MAMDRRDIIAVSTIFTFAVLVRYTILNAFGVLPSMSDGGGDIYNAYLITSGQFSNPLVSNVPPLYHILLVAPAAYLLGPFYAIEFIEILTSSMIAFPAYLFLRRLGVSKQFTYLGTILFALSYVFGNMVTWNSGFNMFSLFFFLFFIVFLLDLTDKPTRRNIILTGVFFSLCFGTHQLTALIATMTLVMYGLGLVIISRKRELFRPLLKVAGLTTLLSLPYAYFYINGILTYTNLGLANYIDWLTVIKYSLLGAWTVDAVTLISIIDFAITIIPLFYFIYKRRPRIWFLVILFGISISGIILDSGNWARTIYYAPFYAIPLVAMGMERIREGIDSSPRVKKWEERKLVSHGQLRFILIVFIALFLFGNIAASSYDFAFASRFYSTFCQGAFQYCQTDQTNDIAALNYIRDNISTSKTFYSSFLVTWIEAYTGHYAVGTYNLVGRITQSSFYQSLYSDIIELGQYNLGNSYFDYGVNYPGNNTLYMVYSQFWVQALTFDKSLSTVTLPDGQSIQLSSARLTGITPSPDNNSMIVSYDYNGNTFVEHVAQNGSTSSFFWTGIHDISLALVVPQYGRAFYNISDYHETMTAHSLTDTFSIQSGYRVYGVSLDAGKDSALTQHISNGVPVAFINSTAGQDNPITISINDDPARFKPYFYDSVKLETLLGIGYYVISEPGDHSLITWLTYDGHAKTIYHNSEVYILEVAS